MFQSRGAVSFNPLFTTDEIGLRKDASIEHVVKVFLTVGEAIAARWIEMPKRHLAFANGTGSNRFGCDLSVRPRAPDFLLR
jgi:hypothetical protein